MKIGIVTIWFNRGQAVVSRQLANTLLAMGHEVYILARPTTESFDLPKFISIDPDWIDYQVTRAKDYIVSESEYINWVKKMKPDVIFFDQNYQFDIIEELKYRGIKTIGRFVWESFKEEHAKPASEAFSVVYSLTKAEQQRYEALGLDSVKINWCYPPELKKFYERRLNRIQKKNRQCTIFYYPGGYLSKRKMLYEVAKAYLEADLTDSKLIIKFQSDKRLNEHLRDIKHDVVADKRIYLVNADWPQKYMNTLLSNIDVMVCPSKWEGLGLHIYEALGVGAPLITNDAPPMNEIAELSPNVLSCPSFDDYKLASGINSQKCNISDLSTAFEKAKNMNLVDFATTINIVRQEFDEKNLKKSLEFIINKSSSSN